MFEMIICIVKWMHYYLLTGDIFHQTIRVYDKHTKNPFQIFGYPFLHIYRGVS